LRLEQCHIGDNEGDRRLLETEENTTMKNAVIAAVLIANALAAMLKGPFLYSAVAVGGIIPAGLITLLLIWLLVKAGMTSNRLSTVLFASGLSAVICVFLSWLGHGAENGFSIPLETLIGSSLFLMVLVLRMKKEAAGNNEGDRRPGKTETDAKIETNKVLKVAGISTGAIAFVLGTVIVHTWMAPAPVHDQLVAQANTAKAGLPVKVDDVTVYRDVRVNGNRMTYVYDVTLDSIDTPKLQANVTKNFCAEKDIRLSLIMGATFGFEYWRSGALLSQFAITSCASEPPGSPA
jgi:hypothetical protein